MKSTFKVLFYLKKGSEKKNGEVMIMARITIDGKLCQFSTKQSILPENWNIAAGWKSHATLTLLATQDLPTFGYNMIDPLKSWCWGSILFYPFKISRFS